MLQEFNPNQKVNLAKEGQFDLSANLSWWRTWVSARWADTYL